MHHAATLATVLRCLPAWTAVLLLMAPIGRVAADGPTGQQIFQQKCASCHGAAGEGVKGKYGKPLAGDKSAAQLSRLIAESMPKDDPGSCKGPDADKVAAYIYDAFYSKSARIALSRLTVRQHQNAIADLIAGFRSPGVWDDKRGLEGEYFDSRQMNRGQRVIDRTDAEIRFDFKDGSPDPKIKPEEFAVRWQGSVLAPETGEYEFVIHSQNGVRLWVNDQGKPLIDGSVRSGVMVELRESIRLLAGRAYPIRLEFFKSKEAKEKTASVSLEWKPPFGVDGPIPPRDLSPNRFPETLVVQAAFPPDDRSLGWERGTTISKAWDQAATDAALETAAYVTSHLRELADVREDAKDRGPKLRDFCRRFAERAFRRPLTDDLKKLYVDHPFDAAPDLDAAVKRSVLLVLLSPRFLYREIGGPDDAYDTASRLSFALWDLRRRTSELLDAAASGKLATRGTGDAAGRADAARHADARQAARLLPPLAAPRPGAGRVQGHAALPRLRPRQVVADSCGLPLDLSLEDAAWNGDSDFRKLLLADDFYLTGRLAKFYSADLPADADFRKVKLDAGKRAGVLTHPYLLACLRLPHRRRRLRSTGAFSWRAAFWG